MVPASAITDLELDQLMEDLTDGRDKLKQTTSRILPNIFNDSASGIEDIRRTGRSAASKARMLGELVLPSKISHGGPNGATHIMSQLSPGDTGLHRRYKLKRRLSSNWVKV